MLRTAWVYKGKVTPGQLESCLCPVLGSQQRADMDALEQVQQRAIKMIKGLEHLTYKERLRKPQLNSVSTEGLNENIPASESVLPVSCSSVTSLKPSVLPHRTDDPNPNPAQVTCYLTATANAYHLSYHEKLMQH